MKWKVTTVFLGLREDILLWTISKCYASHVTVVRVISEVYDMARPKVKDVRYMNVSLDCRFYEKFSAFCEKYDMSKTGATEKAIQMYMEAVDKAMSSVDKDK